MNSVSQKNHKILISRYLSGELSPDEILELHKWLDSSQDNLIYFRQLKNIWDNSKQCTDENLISVDKAFNQINKRIVFRTPGANFWFYWKKIAAVILVPLILGNLLYFVFCTRKPLANNIPVYNEIFAAFGTRSAIKLSDGSSLWLNSGSSIKYPDRFVGNNRTVYLNGEAYFEVESNPKKPFIVKTSSVTVRATGTKFNVMGYSTDEEACVTLVSGKVDVSMTDVKNHITSSTLNVNHHLSFNKTEGTSSVQTVDTYKYISWKDGKLIFRDEPLSSVVKKIGRIFNVDIELKGNELQKYTYRATFQDESLDEIMKLLKISSPINYFEPERILLPDNTFPKKKIIIYPAGKIPL